MFEKIIILINNIINRKNVVGESNMLNNNLKFCREELELTQVELGFVFGVSRTTISNWENEYNIMLLPKLIKFCNLYNFSIDFVVGLSRKNIQYGKFKTSKKIIGNKLKDIRKKLHLSQQDFCDKCKISQSTYSRYETGKQLITSTNLYIICKTYKISMDEICGREYIDL